MTKTEWIEKLKSLGFKDIEEVEIEVGFDAGEHTHDIHTAHVILEGELTIEDKSGKITYKVNDFVEFPEGTTHKAFGGKTKGKMLVGFKQ